MTDHATNEIDHSAGDQLPTARRRRTPYQPLPLAGGR